MLATLLDGKEDIWEHVTNINIGTSSNTATNNKSIKRGLAYHNKVYRAIRKHLQDAGNGYYAQIEPWLRRSRDDLLRQPDAVLIDAISNTGIVVEVKLNWRDGRDKKLLEIYLEAAQSAFELDEVWPLVITSNIRGYKGRPILGIENFEDCLEWTPDDLTPVLLHI